MKGQKREPWRIIVAIIAFIFAITTSNTITKESTVIGTLRASGYSKGELIRHYLAMPMLVTLIAAVVGNILGYTIMEDFAADIYARLTFPLFTPRVNLTLWMPVQEYYSTGPEVNAYRRIEHDGYMTGWVPGDIYVSTDIMLLMQEKHQIDAVLRAVLKSASGYSYHYARNYDGPGYFFDATFGRSFPVGSGKTVFRTALSGGFLCWQTDNGRQNDAVMYGILASMKSGRFGIEAEYGGYVGWEQCGDAPMTLKSSASWDIGDFSLRLQHQVGLVDWPFHQIRFGVEYRFRNIFKTNIK